MIFVTLGTQDKSFKRLLEMVDNAIAKGIIKEKVIVQAGITKYESKNMDIFDFKSNEEILNLIKDAKYIITHGGVGTIFNCLKNDKKIIAVARLAKYNEHHNDHQLQLIKEFSNQGYIIDGSTDLIAAIKKINTFTPKKYHSNNKNFINNLEEYITNH